MGCLDENTIVEFIQGTLSLRDAREVEEHVDGCASCRQLLAEMARTSFAVLSPSLASFTDEPSIATDSNPSMEGLRPGQVVAGRYRVVRFLGKGGMGWVYEVDDLQLQDRVALKLLRSEVKDLPRLLQHLKHEVVLGRRISHPNVCRLHDIGSFAGNHFITMSLVHGENLTGILSREVPPVEWAARIALQICDALEAAHEQGVVHRDLKSSNIMVDTKGKVTVMDFGLARDLWGEPSQSGMLIGSPAYWSPEQACGQRATERSDIYSFGVVACELFGARRPLMGKVELSRVPARFRPVLERCLQANCEDRYGSAREVKEALLAAERGPAPARRWAVAVGAATVVVVLGAGGVLAYHFLRPAAKPQHPLALASPAARARSKPLPTSEGGAQPEAKRGRDVDPAAPRARREKPAPALVFSPDEVVKSKAGRRRPRRPRHRPQPVAPPPQPAPAPTPPTKQEPERPSANQALLATLSKKVDSLEADRARRGFLVEDLPGYRQALAAARRTLRGGDGARARPAVGRMEAELGQSKVDKAFIAGKLARLTRLKTSRKLDSATGKKVHKIFSQVHSTYFAGNYKTANMHLNRLWRILRGKGS
jgi:predicted Ser/Thr protein kinase